MLFAAISKDRNCHYCEAAHIACCRMLGVNQSLLDDLVRDVNSISVPKVCDMILFGLKCSREPQNISEADYEKLRRTNSVSLRFGTNRNVGIGCICEYFRRCD